MLLIGPNVGQVSHSPLAEVASHEGYLREGPGLYGQNDVTHLKLGGSIVDLSFSDGTTSVDGLGKPSTCGVPWIKVRVNTKADGTGTNSILYTHFIVNRGQVVSASAKAIVPTGQPYAGQVMALHATGGWIDDRTWFFASGGAAQWEQPYQGYWAFSSNISVWKLNPAGTLLGGASGAYNTNRTLSFNPALADASYFETAVIARAKQLASSIITYGTNYATDNPAYSAKEPAGIVTVPHFESFEDKFFPQDLNPDSWGDLASDCYSQIQCWDGNAAAYFRDSLLLVPAAKSTISSVKAVLSGGNPVQVAKSLASLFLSFRYGWCLQARDTMSLLAIDFDRAYPLGLARRSTSRSYYRNGVPVTARMGVYFNPFSDKLTELGGFLRAVDLDFTLENIWDLVPLSFVVDWFTGLGDLFERMDQMAQLDSFGIRLIGRSLKTAKSLVYQKTSGRTDWHGIVTAVYYKRQYQTEPIQPSLISYRNPNQNFDHWLEGTALIVQRL